MSLDIRQKIQDFVRERPEYLLYKESEILSIMESEGRVSAQDVEKATSTSAFGYGFNEENVELVPQFTATKNTTKKVDSATQVEKNESIEFVKQYLQEASKGASELYENYLDDYGPLDMTWNILKNIVNRFDISAKGNTIITLEEMERIKNEELKFSKRVNRSKTYASLEVLFERERGIKYDAKKVLDFREKSNAYLAALASKEKYELIKEGLKELRILHAKEQNLNSFKVQGQMISKSSYQLKSFDEKLIELLDSYCNNDQNLRKEFIAKISEGITSKEELNSKILDVLSSLEEDVEQLYKQQLNGKSFAQYELEYHQAYQSTLGGENPKDMVEGWINRQKQGAQYVKFAAIIATTTMTGGTNLLAAGKAKLVKHVGAGLGNQLAKLCGVGIGTALDYTNAIASSKGLTAEKNKEILTNSIHMLPYAFFGANVSGPFGDKIVSLLRSGKASSIMPKILDSAFSKGASVAGYASEVSLDVLFELVISDGELVDIITGNATGEAQARMLNKFFYMLHGGRMKGANNIAIQNVLKQSGLEDYKVSKTEDGKFELSDSNGRTQTFDTIEEIVAGSIVKVVDENQNIAEESVKLPEDNSVPNEVTSKPVEANTKENEVSSLEEISKNVDDNIKVLSPDEPKIEKKKSMKILKKGEPAVRELDETLKQQVNDEVNKIRKKFLGLEDYLTNTLRKANFDKIGRFIHRVKGEQSLHDKLANYLKENPDATIVDALSDVRDAYACRTIAKNIDYRNHPEVLDLLKSGDEKGALLKAAELQAEPAVSMLKALIEEEAAGKSDFFISRISNYVSEDGIPYFSEAQLAELKQYAYDLGVHIDFVKQIPKTDPKYDEIIKEGYEPTTKSKKSGYTALQINFKTKNGDVFEWQFRGEKVNIFAEGEHIIYDLRTNKDIIGDIKELKPLYEPIKQLVDEKNMPKEVYKKYNEYLTDYYIYLRRQELGFDATKPVLEDYEINGYKFDKLLEAETLIRMHDYGEKIKYGLLSGKDAKRILDNYIYNGLEEFVPMSKNEFKEYLNSLGYSDYDIRNVNLENKELQAVVVATKSLNDFGKLGQIDFSKEYLEEMVFVDAKDAKQMGAKYLNRNNIEYIKRFVDLENEPSLLKEIVKMKNFEPIFIKLEELAKDKKLNTEDISILSKLKGKDFNYITKDKLDLIKKLQISNAAMFKFGQSEADILDVCISNKEFLDDKYILKLVKNTLTSLGMNKEANVYIDADFALGILNNLKNLKALKEDSFTKFTLASIKYYKNIDDKSTIDFIKEMQKKLDDSYTTSLMLTKFVQKNSKIDLKDFAKYLNSVDFDSLKKRVPIMNIYTNEDALTFLRYHYKLGTKVFSQSDLSLTEDFADFLSKNYLGEDILKLLTIFPGTYKEIGRLPEGWSSDSVGVDVLDTSIRECIEKFRKIASKYPPLDMSTFSSSSSNNSFVVKSKIKESKEYTDKRLAAMEDFKNDLSKVLGKNVDIKALGAGSFGTGYKIEVEGATPVVLKVFHNSNAIGNNHGQWAEVYRGPFLNNHSKDFVYFYFGKVPSAQESDGFLVTEYLDNRGNSIHTDMHNDIDYKISTKDDALRNRRGAKLIDYGALQVVYEGENEPIGIDEIIAKKIQD